MSDRKIPRAGRRPRHGAGSARSVSTGSAATRGHRSWYPAWSGAPPTARYFPGAQLGEHRRLVARARTDVEDAVALAHLEQLAHPRDHVRLGDRLAVPDRQGLVLVGEVADVRGHEQLARNLGHRLENALVADAA